ncbi:YveK family protein [Mycobacterium sp. C31M]
MRAPVDVPRVRDYLTILAKGWAIILLATLLAPGAAYLVQKLTWERSYTASALLFASVAGDPGTYSAYAGGLGANSRMTTYSALAQSRVISQRAIDEAGLPMTAEQLAADTSATWEPYGINRFGRPSSVLLRVTVAGADADTTVKAVNALARNLMQLSGELEWIQAEPTDAIQYTGPVAELIPVDAATTAHAVEPDVTNTLIVAAGVGFALSTVLVLAFGIARDNVLTRGQLVDVVNVTMSGKP